MSEGKHVSHIPSYGAEMRGGTANCSVVVSDTEIASPLVPRPSVCIVLNTPSLIKFQPLVREGGLPNLERFIDVTPDRADIELLPVAANEIAEAAGSYKAANMVALERAPEEAPLDCFPGSAGRVPGPGRVRPPQGAQRHQPPCPGKGL